MNQNVHQMIQALGAHFGKRHESEVAEEAWLYGMYQNLKGYPSEILKTATDQIIASREERSFPQVAEIKRVCDGLLRVKTFAVKHDATVADPVINAAEKKARSELAAEFRLGVDKAAEWRQRATEEYGSVDNALKVLKPRNFWENKGANQ